MKTPVQIITKSCKTETEKQIIKTAKKEKIIKLFGSEFYIQQIDFEKGKQSVVILQEIVHAL